MRVERYLLKSVAFIGHNEVPKKHGDHPVERYDGTGFFVSVPSKVPGVLPFVYLVTAKHIVEAAAPNFWIRQNLKAGGVDPEPCDDLHIKHPTDPTVDVAVFPWALSDALDHEPIPLERFATPEKFTWDIRVGDEVFLIGVFPSASGLERNTPMVRKGNLAMIPEGKLRVKRMEEYQEIDAYLIEAHSFGGISGSPVFARSTEFSKAQFIGDGGTVQELITRSSGDYHLLGLVWGHFEIDDEDVNRMHPRPPLGQETGLNLGIGIVVPATKIIETLNHPKLARQREAMEQRHIDSGPSAVQDFLQPERKPGRGPEPERLKIDVPMDDAVKQMFKKGKPRKRR